MVTSSRPMGVGASIMRGGVGEGANVAGARIGEDGVEDKAVCRRHDIYLRNVYT